MESRKPIIRWPSVKHVVVVWTVLTTLAFVAYILYLRGLPNDELAVASTLGFQAMVGVLFVVLPAVAVLLLFLLLGALTKRWLLRSTQSQ